MLKLGSQLLQLAAAAGDPAGYTGRLKTFIVRRGIALDYLPDLGDALGV
jgi:hypothetical protein